MTGKKNIFFVTGTDTDAGKTVICCALLKKAQLAGLSTIAVKPVASGCEVTSHGLRNNDALLLSDTMTEKRPYEQINPTAFQPAIAPHIAAAEQGVTLSSEEITKSCYSTLSANADFSLIEGAGGWRVPLSYNGKAWLSDIPKLLDIPVILVVGMKLGCINHARLSVEAIINDGVTMAGWVANKVDPEMACFNENVETLKTVMPGPLLGCIPYLSSVDPECVAPYISMKNLIKLP